MKITEQRKIHISEKKIKGEKQDLYDYIKNAVITLNDILGDLYRVINYNASHIVPIRETIEAIRTTSLTAGSIDTWTDVPLDTVVKSRGDIDINDDGEIVFAKKGIYIGAVGIHLENTKGSSLKTEFKARTLCNGSEVIGSQFRQQIEKDDGAFFTAATVSHLGYAEVGQTAKLQFMVGDTDLIIDHLTGDFDNDVAVTFTLTQLSTG